ncbi:hypothetical protein ABH927_003118 [Planotetraspora sp. GP83]
MAFHLAYRKDGSRRVTSRMLLTTGAVVAMLAVTASPASAHYYSGGGSSPSFTIKPYSYNSTWMTPLNQALLNWNASPTAAYITKPSSSPSWLVAASYSATWYGLYTPYNTRSNRYFRIQLNARTISRDASNWSNFVTSSFTHELGHRLSLDDITDGSHCTDAIMSYCRNRNTMTKPQSHDIDDVNAIY